jgi:hypothetical protein
MAQRIAVVTVFLVALSSPALAARRFLVPIYLTDPVPGAFGSLWASELTVLNTGSSAAVIQNYGLCPPINTDCVFPLAPGVSMTSGGVRNLVSGYGIPAVVLTVEDRYADQLSFTSRVRDIAASAQSWGAWIPIVPETAAVHGPLPLLDVPVNAAYRQTLRVYSFDRATPAPVVRVRIYANVPVDPDNPASYEQPNPVIADLLLPLRNGLLSPASPLYAEIGNLAAVPGVAGHETVWLSIEPQTVFGIWAMVSITNNTSQEVTMILPHRTE